MRGHVGIDDFVVGHARARRVGESDVARLVGFHQTGHAQHRIGPEAARVEEIVVNAPVNHVHPLEAPRRAHEHHAVLDHQVAALDQFDAHLLGEEQCSK